MQFEEDVSFSRGARSISKLKVLWPLLFTGILSYAISALFINKTDGLIKDILNFMLALCEAVFVAGYQAYVLKLSRLGNASFKDILECIRYKFWRLIGYSLLSALVFFSVIFLPAILALSVNIRIILIITVSLYVSLTYCMAQFLLVDTEKGIIDSLSTSRKLMSGRRYDYFKFILSLSKAIIITWIIDAILGRIISKCAAGMLETSGFEEALNILRGVTILTIIRYVIMIIVSIWNFPRIKIGAAEYYDNLAKELRRPKIKFVIANQNNSLEEIPENEGLEEEIPENEDIFKEPPSDNLGFSR